MTLREEKIAVKKKLVTGKKVSYTINTDVLDEFNRIAKIKGYNKQRTIENLMKMFIESETTL